MIITLISADSGFSPQHEKTDPDEGNWLDLNPPTQVLKTSPNGGFSISTIGYLNPHIKPSLTGQYFIYNKSFTQRTSNNDTHGIRFLFARGKKIFQIMDDNAPLSLFLNQEVIKFTCAFRLDVDERELYNYDIEVEDAGARAPIIKRMKVPITEVLIINANIKKLNILRYEITLNKIDNET